jgi:hypothetical protein
MFSKSSLQSRRFLVLATKVVSGEATPPEIEELRTMKSQNKEFAKELRQMQLEARHDRNDELLVVFLRVLFGTARPAEVVEVNGLAKTNPEQWVAFQHLRFALEEFGQKAESRPGTSSSTEPNLERIRESVLTRLKLR